MGNPLGLIRHARAGEDIARPWRHQSVEIREGIVLTTIANDHFGLRVTDMARSIEFYEYVFGAEKLTKPFVMSGKFPEEMFEGKEGVEFLFCHMRFGQGRMELFEFRHPKHGPHVVHATEGNVTHVGFQVDDVEATVARLLESGGSLVFPVTCWGDNLITYAMDPDGNVIELADASLDELLVGTIAQFPESAPDPG